MVAAAPQVLETGPVSKGNIHQLLARFYSRFRQKPQLGPVFARAVGTTDAEWALHLAHLADFWSSVMLRSSRYHGDPFSTHLHLPDLEPAMFDRWLALDYFYVGENRLVIHPDKCIDHSVCKPECLAEPTIARPVRVYPSEALA